MGFKMATLFSGRRLDHRSEVEKVTKAGGSCGKGVCFGNGQIAEKFRLDLDHTFAQGTPPKPNYLTVNHNRCGKRRLAAIPHVRYLWIKRCTAVGITEQVFIIGRQQIGSGGYCGRGGQRRVNPIRFVIHVDGGQRGRRQC